jgi:hypothetical protein
MQKRLSKGIRDYGKKNGYIPLKTTGITSKYFSKKQMKLNMDIKLDQQ